MRLKIEGGTIPDKLFEKNERKVRFFSLPRLFGSSPTNLVLPMESLSRDNKLPRDGGTVPVRLFTDN